MSLTSCSASFFKESSANFALISRVYVRIHALPAKNIKTLNQSGKEKLLERFVVEAHQHVSSDQEGSRGHEWSSDNDQTPARSQPGEVLGGVWEGGLHGCLLEADFQLDKRAQVGYDNGYYQNQRREPLSDLPILVKKTVKGVKNPATVYLGGTSQNGTESGGRPASGRSSDGRG